MLSELPIWDVLLRSDKGIRISQNAYQQEEAEERNRGGHKVLWRWDTEDRLENPDNPALCAWHRRSDPASRAAVDHLLQGQRPTLVARHQVHRDLGLHVRIRWIPRSPLTDYQQFRLRELHAYQGSGFDVRMLPPAPIQGSGLQHLPSIVLFEEEVLYIEHFTSPGRSDGATRIRDPLLIAEATEAIQHLDALSLRLPEDVPNRF